MGIHLQVSSYKKFKLDSCNWTHTWSHNDYKWQIGTQRTNHNREFIDTINNGNRTEWCPIQSVIVSITKFLIIIGSLRANLDTQVILHVNYAHFNRFFCNVLHSFQHMFLFKELPKSHFSIPKFAIRACPILKLLVWLLHLVQLLLYNYKVQVQVQVHLL